MYLVIKWTLLSSVVFLLHATVRRLRPINEDPDALALLASSLLSKALFKLLSASWRQQATRPHPGGQAAVSRTLAWLAQAARQQRASGSQPAAERNSSMQSQQQ